MPIINDKDYLNFLSTLRKFQEKINSRINAVDERTKNLANLQDGLEQRKIKLEKELQKLEKKQNRINQASKFIKFFTPGKILEKTEELKQQKELYGEEMRNIQENLQKVMKVRPLHIENAPLMKEKLGDSLKASYQLSQRLREKDGYELIHTACRDKSLMNKMIIFNKSGGANNLLLPFLESITNDIKTVNATVLASSQQSSPLVYLSTPNGLGVPGQENKKIQKKALGRR